MNIFADASKNCIKTVYDYITKMAKCRITQMKTHTLNSFDSISIIGVPKNVTLDCDTNKVHEGATMWLFHLLVNKTASAVL